MAYSVVTKYAFRNCAQMRRSQVLPGTHTVLQAPMIKTARYSHVRCSVATLAS